MCDEMASVVVRLYCIGRQDQQPEIGPPILDDKTEESVTTPAFLIVAERSMPPGRLLVLAHAHAHAHIDAHASAHAPIHPRRP